MRFAEYFSHCPVREQIRRRYVWLSVSGAFEADDEPPGLLNTDYAGEEAAAASSGSASDPNHQNQQLVLAPPML